MQNKIISILGSSGGAGQTVCSINLAYIISKYYRKKVAVIDLNFYQPDCATILNIIQNNSIINLIDNYNQIDKDSIHNCASRSNAIECDIFSASTNTIFENLYNKNFLVKAIVKIAQFYDYVIIDSSKNIDSSLIEILDLTNKIILLSNSTTESIINANRWISRFNDLGYEQEKVICIVNKTKPYDIKFKLAIDHPHKFELSFDHNVLNNSKFLFSQKVSKQLCDISSKLSISPNINEIAKSAFLNNFFKLSFTRVK